MSIELVELGHEGFGFSFIGGTDSKCVVSKIQDGGAFQAAGIKVGDVLVGTESVDFEGLTHQQVSEEIKKIIGTSHPKLRIIRQPGKGPGNVPSDTPNIKIASPSQKRSSQPAEQPRSRNENGHLPSFSKSDMKEIDTTAAGGFGARLTQLVELISERGTKGMERLAVKFGGVEGLAHKLKSDIKNGIPNTEEELEERRRVYGKNSMPNVKPKNLLQLMWEAVQDPILIVLMVAAIVNLVLGVSVGDHKETGWIEGVAILVSVFVVVMVTAVNDLQKERQFRELVARQQQAQLIDVMRGGKKIQVPKPDIVVGDIVLISSGLLLPADGVLIDGSNIACDESALTGEPHDIPKNAEKAPWMLSGTAVKQGTGHMIITCVGLFSEEGIIQKLITGVGIDESERLQDLDQEGMTQAEIDAIADKVDQRQQENFDELSEKQQAKLEKQEKKKERKKESILQAKLEKMALQIGYFAIVMAVLTFLVLIIRFCVETYAVDKKGWDADHASEMLDFLIVGITVLVVAIPEGLPLAVTISLAYSVKKMMKDKNLVRVLAACETMGNATTICSDKTGTLTKNRMTVIRAWACGKTFEKPEQMQIESALEPLAQGIAINSDKASTYSISEEDGLPIQEGNKTECACLQFADSIAPKNFEQYRNDLSASDLIKIFPFSSAKKRMMTVVKLSDGRYRLYVKGASEMILRISSSYHKEDGSTVPLSDDDKNNLDRDVINNFAEQALRVICIAFRDFDTEQDWEKENELAQNLTISAFVGIMDPLRDEVKDAVSVCKEAGVVVRMVTGDNLVTARAIAINCGIITPEDTFAVMEGPEFRRRVVKSDGSLDYDEIRVIGSKLRVMARCSPTDKYNLVKGLIKAKEVVAVTGDGTNDGPALSEADVGFAMGIAGTGVAKEASDIIITDDNFNSIVKAISWGRNVYDSISKFLVFQLTVNVVAVIIAFVGAAAFNESPLKAVQMLWVNLIMDTFAALALATEPPTPSLLKRKPYGRNKALLSRIMLRQILGHSVYQLVVMFIILFGPALFALENFTDQLDREYCADTPTLCTNGHPNDSDDVDHDTPTTHFTVLFNTFVFMQIFNELNARVIHDDLYIEGYKWLGPIGAFARPFVGFFNNWIFLFVIIGTIAVQAIIVEFGGRAISTEGLSAENWGICLGFGLGSLVWNVVLHYLFPWYWIPESMEPGKYEELTPDRAAQVDEDDADKAEEEESSLRPGGLDAGSEGTRSPQVEPRQITETEPEEESRGGILWRNVFGRLRRQMRVASAFRTAGHIARLRRRTSKLARHAIGGPDGRAGEHSSHPAPSPAAAMWRTAVARLRYQIRVVRAFRQSVVSELGQQSPTTPIEPSSNSVPLVNMNMESSPSESVPEESEQQLHDETIV